jgi:hypothetical protein
MSLVSQLLRPEDLAVLNPAQLDLIEQHLEGVILKHLANSRELQEQLEDEAKKTVRAFHKS